MFYGAGVRTGVSAVVYWTPFFTRRKDISDSNFRPDFVLKMTVLGNLQMQKLTRFEPLKPFGLHI